jgi:hypothetical protein
MKKKSIKKHIHHIIPKHMGGTDNPSNLVEVTVEEHALAHKRLYEKYRKREDYISWKSLEGQINQTELQYYRSRLGGLKNKGKTKSEEHKRKIALANLGKKLSKNTKEKISIAQTGQNNSMYGKKRSQHYKKVTQSLAMKKAWYKKKTKNRYALIELLAQKRQERNREFSQPSLCLIKGGKNDFKRGD